MSNPTQQILVVEDDDISLMIAQHILNKAGYEVQTALNGEEAIACVSQARFGLILMDIEMPIMDGLEATPIIRDMENGKEVPIVALTAHSIPEKEAEYRKAGINEHLIKPLDPIKLAAIASQYLS